LTPLTDIPQIASVRVEDPIIYIFNLLQPHHATRPARIVSKNAIAPTSAHSQVAAASAASAAVAPARTKSHDVGFDVTSRIGAVQFSKATASLD